MSIMHFLLAAVTVDNNGNVSGGSGLVSAGTPLKTVIGQGVNALSYIIGAVSVIMILVGALRYVLSGGNPQSTKEAKDTILYAVVGLIIALSAYAIVNYVLHVFNK